ncbi:MAG: hypothetical protein WCA77_04220 [Thermoplasmata archaeon]
METPEHLRRRRGVSAPKLSVVVVILAFTLSGAVSSVPFRGNPTVKGVHSTLLETGRALELRATLPNRFAISFTEVGLPSKANWSVTLNGSEKTSSVTNLTFELPNGTYSFWAGGPAGYSAGPVAGNITVDEGPVNQTLAFSVTNCSECLVAFVESGLPPGVTWKLNASFVDYVTGQTTISFVEPNGTYPYSAGLSQGYGASPSSGSFSVDGTPVVVELTFAKVYLLKFTEASLPKGTNWSLTLTGSKPSIVLVSPPVNGTFVVTSWSHGAEAVEFNVSNGNYSYVGYAFGYAHPSGVAVIDGKNALPVVVNFNLTNPFQLPIADYALIGFVGALLVLATVVGLRRRGGRTTPDPSVDASTPSAGDRRLP